MYFPLVLIVNLRLSTGRTELTSSGQPTSEPIAIRSSGSNVPSSSSPSSAAPRRALGDFMPQSSMCKSFFLGHEIPLVLYPYMSYYTSAQHARAWRSCWRDCVLRATTHASSSVLLSWAIFYLWQTTKAWAGFKPTKLCLCWLTF